MHLGPSAVLYLSCSGGETRGLQPLGPRCPYELGSCLQPGQCFDNFKASGCLLLPSTRRGSFCVPDMLAQTITRSLSLLTLRPEHCTPLY